ncbi:MAG: YARHG domain-containing protein [Bacteroidota bacterium]
MLRLLISASLFLSTALVARAQLDPLDTLLPIVVEAETSLDEVGHAFSLLRLMDRGDVRLLRNAVYARHGHVFQDKEVAAFFGAQSWYRPAKNGPTAPTDVDLTNLQLLHELEDALAEREPPALPFYEFVALFPVVDLPFSLQQAPENDLHLIEEIGEAPPPETSPVQRFLAMDEPGRYYALAVLPVTGDFVPALVKHEAFSGGYDDRYYLVTFTPDGEQIDFAQVMRYTGSDVEEATGDVVVTPTLVLEQSWETTRYRAETGERLRTCAMTYTGQIDPTHGYLQAQEDGPPCVTGDAR